MLQCKTKWKKSILSNLSTLEKGVQVNGDLLSEKGLFPVINGGIEPSGYYDKYNREPNTITISEGGNSCGFVNYMNVPFWSGGHCYTLANVKDIDVKYLYHFLKFQEHNIMKLRLGSGLPNIQRKDIENFKIVFIEEDNNQQKIADILSTCDEVIEKTEETIEKYKQIKAGMMQDLFTRGLDENGKLRPTYAQAPDLYKYSEELDRYIPKDWDVKPLCEITDYISRGISPIYSDKETKYKILNQACIYTDQFRFENTKYITENCWNKVPADKKVHKNDVFINSTGTGTLGRVNVYLDNNDNYTFDSHVTVIRFKNDQDAYFYCNYLNNKKQQEYIEINCVTGSTNQIELARTPFIKMPVINPDPGEQKLLSKVLVSIDSKINTEQKTLSKYKQIKQGLMKRLLTPPADAEIVEE